MAGESVIDRTFIVDADVHVHDSPSRLIPYCDEPWRASLEEIEEIPARYLDIPGFAPQWEGIDPAVPGEYSGSKDDTYGQVGTRAETTSAGMRAALTELAIDAAVLFPDNLLKLATLPDPRYAAALARAYNRWLVDEWSGEDGLYLAIVACPQDPEAAAAEIAAHAGRDEVVAAYLPTAGVNPLWGNRRYDPIFASAEDAGLPVVLHTVGIVHPAFPYQVEQIETMFARHALQHPFGMIANLVSMMSTGVPVRFPRLDIAFTESGICWVPMIAWRLDKEFIELRRQVPFFTEKPSTYIRQMYFATQPIEEPDRRDAIATIIEAFEGDDCFVFASDWPHHDFDHPRHLTRLGLSEDVWRKVMGGNAANLFGVPWPGEYASVSVRAREPRRSP